MTFELRLSAQEFCYWLQGAIEIGDLRVIDAEQREKILGMLDRLTCNTPFTFACRTVLLMCPEDARSFTTIYEELQKCFLHDIDPTYEGDQQFFQAVHRGEVDAQGNAA